MGWGAGGVRWRKQVRVMNRKTLETGSVLKKLENNRRERLMRWTWCRCEGKIRLVKTDHWKRGQKTPQKSTKHA